MCSVSWFLSLSLLTVKKNLSLTFHWPFGHNDFRFFWRLKFSTNLSHTFSNISFNNIMGELKRWGKGSMWAFIFEFYCSVLIQVKAYFQMIHLYGAMAPRKKNFLWPLILILFMYTDTHLPPPQKLESASLKSYPDLCDKASSVFWKCLTASGTAVLYRFHFTAAAYQDWANGSAVAHLV